MLTIMLILAHHSTALIVVQEAKGLIARQSPCTQIVTCKHLVVKLRYIPVLSFAAIHLYYIVFLHVVSPHRLVGGNIHIASQGSHIVDHTDALKFHYRERQTCMDKGDAIVQGSP